MALFVISWGLALLALGSDSGTLETSIKDPASFDAIVVF